MARIFISYRRADSAAYAGRLFDRLRSHFGQTEVFMDLEAIEAGERFEQVIVERARAAKVLIALIGKDWLTLQSDGARRLDDPHDLVVREIETALQAGALVIPVLAGKTEMPARHQLPARIAALAERNAIELSDARFHDDVGRLIKVIERAAPDARRRPIVRWTMAAAAVVMAIAAGIWLMRPGSTPTTADAKPAAKPAEQVTSAPPPTAPAPVAAPTGPMSWEQIKALPVIYSESFDSATVVDVWKPAAPPSPPWTEELKGARYCASNSTSDTGIHYIQLGVGQNDLRDAPVFVRVQVEARNPTEFAGGGVLYRFDEAARSYYSFILSPQGDTTFWRRGKEGMSKLYSGTAKGAAPGKPTLIGMAARGDRFYLFVDEVLVATVDDAELRGGRIGVIAMSKGRFCFDDFTVRGSGK